MKRKLNAVGLVSILSAVAVPLLVATPVFAASGDVTSVQNFIKAVIKVIASIAGLIATGFFVMGGITYITSSGNPERLDKAKQTLFFSALGLAITIGAFVITNIVVDLGKDNFGG